MDTLLTLGRSPAFHGRHKGLENPSRSETPFVLNPGIS